MKIFFFHHAGGDQYAYRNFKPIVKQNNWKGIYYDHPGHGERFGEPLISDIHQMADETFDALKDDFNGNYAFFGVSMGTLISYLLLQKLIKENLPLPKHFFAASRKCPASYQLHPKSTHLNGDEFWAVISKYGGCPPALIEHKELRELYEPIIRSDFKALEDYSHNDFPKIDVPASILYGKEDRFNAEEMESWRNYFSSDVNIQSFEGGHFFCYEQADKMMDIVKQKLDF